MKKMLFIAVIALISLASCKKEDMSKYATKDDVANSKTNIKTSTFAITFSQTTTWGTAPYMERGEDDIVLTFIHWDDLGADKTWTQCPVTFAGLTIVPETTKYSLFINAVRADGQAGSPFAQSKTLDFKVVVIPVSQYKANPGVDYSSYSEVAETFNIKD